MVKKVEVISSFATAVCKCWDVSDMVASTCLQPSNYRPIHSIKFSATSGDQLEYNGGQGASG